MEKDLQKRIRKLEDIEEIKNLKSTYMYRMDDRDWEGMLDCFSEDCEIEYGAFGNFHNKKELEKFIKEVLPPVMSFTMHVNMNPIIKIDGDVATGKFYMQCAATIAETNKAIWGGVQYDDTFKRENDGWKIKSLSITYLYFSPYEEGWAKTKMMEFSL